MPAENRASELCVDRHMEQHETDDHVIIPFKEGVMEYGKFSYPVAYGSFSEIRTADHVFQFNLNGQIKYIRGKGRAWPHPAEWLKRTAGNDWVYYSAGDYKGVYDLLGEYYYPYFSYPSNGILGDNPFQDRSVQRAMDAWAVLREQLKELHTHALPPGVEETVSLIELQCPATLRENAERLHRLIRGRVTVLPPDSRHVDYDVIPITLAQGCLLNCGFCRVKSGQGFEALTFAEIAEQIAGVRKLYGRDVHNYNAIFFGQHDALQAGTDTLLFAAEKVHDILGIQHSCMKGLTLFMFGSPVSFINASEVLFERLDKLPFSTYINVGLEAADCATLTELRRPVSVELVRDAFSRMLDINQRYQHVEVTANFVFNDRSSPDHFDSLLALTGSRLDPTRAKGAIYLSPMLDGTTVTDARRRDLIRRFHEVKAHNRLPTFLYLIQRL